MCYYWYEISSDIYKVTLSAGLLPQHVYNSLYNYCDWKVQFQEKITFKIIVNIGIIYTHSIDNTMYDPLALPVFLSEVDWCNHHRDLGDYYLNVISFPIRNGVTCGSLIRILITQYNVSIIFGGHWAECRKSVINELSDNYNFLFFFNGEVDDLVCYKNIINVGPTPWQLLDVLIKETGFTKQYYIIITNTTSLYSYNLANLFNSVLNNISYYTRIVDETEWKNIKNIYNNINSIFKVSEISIINTLNNAHDIIQFLEIVKRINMLDEVDFVHISLDEGLLDRINILYNISVNDILPINSYFISNFFPHLFSLSNDFSRFDVKFDVNINHLMLIYYGDDFKATKLSVHSYLAFEMFKKMVMYTKQVNADEIRESLYSRGFSGPAGPTELHENNYLAMRIYLGKYNWETLRIEVIQSPNSLILPYDCFYYDEICNFKKYSTIFKPTTFYHIIMIFEIKWNIASYLTTLIEFVDNIVKKNYLEEDSMLVKPHIIFSRTNPITENFLEIISEHNVLGVIGCFSVSCASKVMKYTEDYHIPFYYFGPYLHIESPYLIFMSINLATSTETVVEYMSRNEIENLVIIDNDYSVLESDDYIKDNKPYNTYLYNLISKNEQKINYYINDKKYYSIKNKEMIKDIFNDVIDIPTVFYIIYSDKYINELFQEYSDTNNNNVNVILIFIYGNYYYIKEELRSYMNGHLLLKSYYNTYSSLDTMSYYFQIKNSYGSTVIITDGLVAEELSLGFIYETALIALKDYVTNNNLKDLGDYLRILSYSRNITSSIGVISLFESNTIKSQVVFCEYDESGSYKYLTSKNTISQSEFDYNYGPKKKYYSISKVHIIIIIFIEINYSIIYIMSIYGIYYYYHISENKIIKHLGSYYLYTLLTYIYLLSLCSVSLIFSPSKSLCGMRVSCVFTLLFLIYILIYTKYNNIRKIAQNKNIFRVRINKYSYIINSIILILCLIIYYLIWFELNITTIDYYLSEQDSSIFENVYIIHCNFYNSFLFVILSVLCLFIIYTVKVGWDIRFINEHYLFNSLLSSAIMVFFCIGIGAILMGLSDRVFALESLYWLYIINFTSAFMWLAIFGRIYIILFRIIL